MPETYMSFVYGYLAVWIILFGFVGLTIAKLTRLEKEISNFKN